MYWMYSLFMHNMLIVIKGLSLVVGLLLILTCGLLIIELLLLGLLALDKA